MQAWAQGAKARPINLHWDANLSRGSVIGLLSDAHLLQSWRVYFARVGFRRGGRRWRECGVWGCCVFEKRLEVHFPFSLFSGVISNDAYSQFTSHLTHSGRPAADTFKHLIKFPYITTSRRPFGLFRNCLSVRVAIPAYCPRCVPSQISVI